MLLNRRGLLELERALGPSTPQFSGMAVEIRELLRKQRESGRGGAVTVLLVTEEELQTLNARNDSRWPEPSESARKKLEEAAEAYRAARAA